MSAKKRVFTNKKVNYLPRAVITILLIVFLYVSYIFIFHKPSLNFEIKNVISLNEFVVSIFEKNSRIKNIDIRLISKDKNFYKFNIDNLIANHELQELNDKKLKLILSNDEEAISFLKKNDGEKIILKYEISYENLFFDRILINEFDLNVDVSPPKIFDVRTDGYVYLGGIGYVAFKTSKDAKNTYLENGNGGIFKSLEIKKNDYIDHLIFFTCSNIPCKQNKIKIISEDMLGNKLQISRQIKTIKNKKWSNIKIFLDKEMITDKYNEIFNSNLDDFTKEDFLKLNKEERLINETYINTVTSKISTNKLFDGKFKSLANSKVSSEYSELRTYYFKNDDSTILDKLYHWGIDLSSVKNDNVYSANSGQVVLVEKSLGIYGGVVIIDHGIGFYTLYSHLDTINVNKGDNVDKQTSLGTTGTSGFAFGDHLHFGVFLQGTPVDPIEFLDKKYLGIKIFDPYLKFKGED